MTKPSRPRVFLDIKIAGKAVGRLTIELFADQAPKTCENFRQLCTAENPDKLSYADCPFHRIVDEFVVQGGDITEGDGTGGASVYGGDFADENVDWRELDQEGLVCMANRGSKDTNSSQFYITLVPCPHLNGKNTVFGQLVGEKSLETLHKFAAVEVDEDADFKPITPVTIAKCGELVRKGQAKQPSPLPRKGKVSDEESTSQARESTDASTSRGRHKRRRSSSASGSPSPARGHGKRTASKHRTGHRPRKREDSQDSRSASNTSTPKPKSRRRSDAFPDHTFRGRPRQRSRSRSNSPARDSDTDAMDVDKTDSGRHRRDPDGREGEHAHNRRRSPPPSRPRSRSPGYRRQRSLPNVYDQYEKAHGESQGYRKERDRNDQGRNMHGKDDFEGGQRSRRREDYDRDYDRHRDNGYGRLGGGDSHGRLGGGDDWDDDSSGIKYKGRGTMKFREKEDSRRW